MAAVVAASLPSRFRVSPFDRAPQRTDDTDAGFAATQGRIWNHRGDIYVPKDVSAGAASWVKYPVHRGACLLDGVAAASTA